jgi:hypothetical protein
VGWEGGEERRRKEEKEERERKENFPAKNTVVAWLAIHMNILRSILELI